MKSRGLRAFASGTAMLSSYGDSDVKQVSLRTPELLCVCEALHTHAADSTGSAGSRHWCTGGHATLTGLSWRFMVGESTS